VNKPPLVSIGLPVFNGEKFISLAIDSILAQDFRDFELIIADNASTDKTPAICAEFISRDARIRYVRSGRNRGAAWNLNRVVELARGRYFKWCAHDDRVSENYVSACVHALEGDGRAVLACGKTQMIDENDIELPIDPGGLPDMTSSFPVQRFEAALHHGTAMHEMHGVFRLHALRRSSLHRPYYGSDRALLAEMALFGTFLRTPAATFYCREHPGRSYKPSDKSQRASFIAGDSGAKTPSEHWELLRHLFDITRAHRQIAPRRRTLVVVLKWAFTPLQLARYSSEALAYIWPSAQKRLREIAWKLFD
jgi:glycosyltransferase involved in cell wall biosynthesis